MVQERIKLSLSSYQLGVLPLNYRTMFALLYQRSILPAFWLDRCKGSLCPSLNEFFSLRLHPRCRPFRIVYSGNPRSRSAYPLCGSRGSRTPDAQIFNLALYQLSYRAIKKPGKLAAFRVPLDLIFF